MYRNVKAAVVGSINADLILRTERVPQSGESMTGTSYGHANGGKGANQAIGLARLGAKTKMIGRLIENLKKNGVDASCVATDGSQTGLAAIILDAEGKNRIIVYEGANAEITPSFAADSITDDLDLLLVQFETKEETVIAAVNKAIEKGITTVIDCGPAKQFALEKMQGATIISPNETETEALTGINPQGENDILKASEILMDRSKAEFVVIKLGERGCSSWDGKELKLYPAYPAKVVDTTAAGDCFTAALALEYLRSRNISSACNLANKAGSIAVSRMGAHSSMPTDKELFSAD